MNNKARLKRNIAIAVIGGAIVGGAAGLASQPPQARPAQSAQAQAVIVEPVPVAAETPPASPLPAAEPAPPAADAGRGVIARAREMAQRADVTSLLALRDEIVQRSKKNGQSESPATQREIEEVDRYIEAARTLRLKIDGEALQKSTSP